MSPRKRPGGEACTSSETPSKSLSDLLSSEGLRRDFNRRALENMGAVGAAEIGSALRRIVAVAVLARILLPEDFGLIAMVTALTVFAERFKDIGLGDAIIRAKDIGNDQLTGLFWVSFAVSAGIALLLASLSEALAWFYREPRLTAVTVVLASTFLMSGLVGAGKLRDWYAASQVVILPTYTEGLPRVLLEAQAMETTVVAYAVGGVPEAILHGVTGYGRKKVIPNSWRTVWNSSCVMKTSEEEWAKLVANSSRSDSRWKLWCFGTSVSTATP